MVEDEAIIAAMIEDMLIELGVTVIGPATSLGKALDLAAATTPDAALLDMNIGGASIEPVAEALRARAVPSQVRCVGRRRCMS